MPNSAPFASPPEPPHAHAQDVSVQDGVSLDGWISALAPIKNARARSLVMKRIRYWSGARQVLAKILCRYVVKYAAQIDEGNAIALVDRIVHKSILSDWKNSDAGVHLTKIAGRLHREERQDLVMLSYLKLLQQGVLPASQSPVQAALVRSGLVIAHNHQLKMASPLYAKVFDLAWIEQQLPGITRPVTIVEVSQNVDQTAEPDGAKPSSASGFYSKLAVLVCCLALVGSAIAAYTREPLNQASAIAEPASAIAASSASSSAVVDPSTASEAAFDRVAFDRGLAHATNGRWLPMVREFCQISSGSTYFTPATKQLEKWVTLYREDLEIAQITFTSEESGSCAIMREALGYDSTEINAGLSAED